MTRMTADKTEEMTDESGNAGRRGPLTPSPSPAGGEGRCRSSRGVASRRSRLAAFFLLLVSCTVASASNQTDKTNADKKISTAGDWPELDPKSPRLSFSEAAFRDADS